MVGFATKKIHIDPAIKAGAKVSLLISSNEYKSEYEGFFHRVLVVDNIYDWNQLKPALDKIEKIDAVVTRREKFISVVGVINEHLGLRGVDYKTSRNFCNKYLMKQQWLKNHVPCAEGICLDNLNGLDEFLKRHSFPLILKKTSAAHSNFVIKTESKEDLLEKLNFLKSKVSGYVASRPIDGYKSKVAECQLLLEEMLHGRELTVDTFVSKGVFIHTPICEYTMTHELGINDSYLPIRTMPTSLSENQEKLVHETVEKALSALTAKNCICHTELFFDEEANTCKVVETTLRGGGNRAEMTRLSTDYDYSLSVFKATVDLEIESPQKPFKAISVIEYFAEGKGIIKELNLDFLNKNKAVSNIKITCQIGDAVEQAKFGGKFIVSLFVEAENSFESKKLALDLFKQVRKSIKIDYS